MHAPLGKTKDNEGEKEKEKESQNALLASAPFVHGMRVLKAKRKKEKRRRRAGAGGRRRASSRAFAEFKMAHFLVANVRW